MPQQSYFNPQTGHVEWIDASAQVPQFSGGGYSGVAGWQPTSFSRMPSQSVNQQTSTPQVSDPAGYQDMRKQVAQGSDFSGNLKSLQDLISKPSSFQADPSYQWRLDQGNQAINRSAAAKGMLGSGNVLAELAKYGQGMASQEYGNQFGRLSDLVRQQQNFGLRSGYFSEPARTTSGFEGGAMVTRRNQNPTYW